MKVVFLDSDVILDYFFDRKPDSDSTAKIFNFCLQKKIIANVSPVIISNVYYILKKKNSHELVLEKIKFLLSFSNVTIINKEIILKAMDSNFKDFEDALQNYSSEFHPDIDTIVTRNIKDFKESKLSVMTPKEFLTSITK